jgi:rhodanese-related sulfurtransferase
VKKSKPSTSRPEKDSESQSTFSLSEKRKITVRKWKNAILVDLREYFRNANNELLPGKKGISISLDQWKQLKEFIPEIDETIKRLQNE